jgi:hypothetical protein
MVVSLTVVGHAARECHTLLVQEASERFSSRHFDPSVFSRPQNPDQFWPNVGQNVGRIHGRAALGWRVHAAQSSLEVPTGSPFRYT